MRADVVARAMRLIARRHRRPRRGRRAGRPPRLQRAPAPPPARGRGRHRAAGHRPGPAGPDGARAARDDDLPIAHVAFAAGFASVRQFNDTVRAVFADTPGGLRRRVAQVGRGVARTAPRPTARPGDPPAAALPAPFSPDSVLGFLGTVPCRASRPVDGPPTAAACACPTATGWSALTARRR